MIRRPFLILSLLFVLIISSGWGFFVHKTIHQLSIYALPDPLALFYFSHQEYMINNAVRADIRRSSDTTEATKHFIDLDVYGENAVNDFPQIYDKAVAQYSEDTIIKYGILPWVIADNYNRLVAAFKTRNLDSILFYSADIGHYIGDANVPLHTTLNYDGQLTGQHGIHSLWESKVPEMFYQEYNFHFKKPTYIKDPLANAWQIIRRTHLLNEELLEAEREVSKNFKGEKYDIVERNGERRYYYTKDFTLLYGQKVNEAVNQQLVRSAKSIADHWYSAWVDAGKPDLKKLMGELDKNEFKKQQQAWKDDELVQKEYLKRTGR